MDINTPYLISQIINFAAFACLLIWPILSLATVLVLKNRDLSPLVKAVWTGIVLMVPIMGAIAFFMINPGKTE
ncbi:MAG: hypothetical protein GXP42_06465 [Chloroflexi bacterium]|nr:hypothetical protein [Chloroflexota bacterium]